jgi:hypothetical protein
LGKNDVNSITNAAKELTNALSQFDLSKVNGAANELEEIGFGDLRLSGTITKLEQQKGAVMELIDLLIEEKSNTNALKQSTGQPVLLFLAGLIPSLRKQLTDEHPNVGALLLKQQQFSMELEAVKRQLNHAQSRHQFLEDKRDCLVEELNYLIPAGYYASDLLTNINKVVSTQTNVLTFPAAIGHLDPNQSERAFDALLNYSLSWKLGRVGEELADYKVIAERHQAALDNSEIALMEWDNLIGVPLSQLVALLGSGIKVETIANLCNAIMVTAAVAAK